MCPRESARHPRGLGGRDLSRASSERWLGPCPPFLSLPPTQSVAPASPNMTGLASRHLDDQSVGEELGLGTTSSRSRPKSTGPKIKAQARPKQIALSDRDPKNNSASRRCSVRDRCGRGS